MLELSFVNATPSKEPAVAYSPVTAKKYLFEVEPTVTLVVVVAPELQSSVPDTSLAIAILYYYTIKLVVCQFTS